MALVAENKLNSPREDKTLSQYKRKFQYQGCKLWSLLNSMGYQTVNIHFYIYIHNMYVTVSRAIRTRFCEICL